MQAQARGQRITMDANGRVYVPAWLREEKRLQPGERRNFEIMVAEDGSIILKPWRK